MSVGLVTYVSLKWITHDDAGDVVAVVLASITMILVSLGTTKSHPPRPLTDLEGCPIATEHRLGLSAPFCSKLSMA